jgi:GNAT superfamily N-acetyltransferase
MPQLLGNPYDEPAGAAPTPSAPGNPYDEESPTSRVRASVAVASGSNPDQVAAQRRLAAYLNVAPAVAEYMPDEVKRLAATKQIEADTVAAPVLQRRYGDPDFAKLAVDDSGPLSKLEKAIGGAVAYMMGADQRGGLPGALHRGIYYNSVESTAGAFRGIAENLAGAGLGPAQFVADGFGKIGRDAAAARDARYPPVADPGTVRSGVDSGVESAAQALKYAPLAFLGPPGIAAALAGMVAEAGGATYQKDREAGVDPLRSTVHAAADTVAEYTFEKYAGAAKFLEKLAAGTPAAKLMMFEITSEMPSEIATTLWQNFNEWAVIHPDKSVKDFVAEQPEAIAQTAIATLVGGSIQVGAGKATMKVAEQVMGHEAEITRAGRAAEMLQEQLKLALDSKLRERDPEQFRAVLQQMAAGAEGAPQSVFVDAEKLNQLPPEVLGTLPEDVLAQMADALTSNGTVEIPIGAALAVAPGTPLEQTLVEHGRVGDPAATTQFEAKEAGKKAGEYLEQQSASVIQQAQDAQAAQASHDAVRQGILDQLTATGRFRQAVNEGYATWTAAFYTTMAGRLGMTSEEMAAKYPLRIVGEAGQGQTLNAGGVGSLSDVTHQWTASGIDSTVSEKDKVITLSKIALEPEARKQGVGTAAMQALTEYADRTGQRIVLSPATDFGATSKGRLVAFYKRFGFVENKGRSKDFTVSESMLREPQARTDETTGLPLNSDGTVTVYHHTSAANAAEIQRTGLLKSAGEPDLYFTTTAETDTGYGDTAVPFRVKPERLLLDDEFPGGRQDFKVETKNAAKARRVRFLPDGQGVLEQSGTTQPMHPSRAAWGQDFPDARILVGESAVKRHPDYHAAKTGDAAAAARLVQDLVAPEAIQSIRQELAGRRPLVASIHAQEEQGVNAIPEALADLIAARLGLETDDSLVQTNIVNHTGADGFSRLARQALFSGDVKSGSEYLIVDDFIGQGGTMANFRGHIQRYNGKVIGAVALTGKPHSAKIGLSDQQLGELRDKHGELEDWWRKRFGFGFDALTQSEARYLARTADADTVRDRVAAAEQAGNGGNGQGFAGGSLEQSAPAASPGPLAQLARGTFTPANLELALSPTADLSTFFHETGHFFLEVMADLASQPGAPVEIAADMKVLLDWFGVPDLATWHGMTLDQQRPHHERFAEGIEQYIIEGKAPSVELLPLFRRWRTWMLSVYKSLQQFVNGTSPGPELSPEVRKVFDRMLASEEQIKQTEEVLGLVPEDDATQSAIERLTSRSIRDLKWSVAAVGREIKKLQAQAAGLRKEVQAEVEAEVDQMPEFRAKAALDALKVNPDLSAATAEWKAKRTTALADARDALKAALYATNPGATGLKKGQLFAKNKRSIENQAEAAVLQWEQANPRPTAGQNATDQDMATVADSFGFPDTETMLAAIDATGKRADLVEAMTDQRMLEEHGDLVDEQAMREAAAEAVHNRARAKSLATELKAQADALGASKDTGKVNAAGSKITVNVLAEAAKQFAQNIVARTVLKDLKAKAWQHQAAERRSASAWQKATAAGKTEEAIKAKQDQMLNHAAARAALDAISEAKDIVAFFRRVVKDGDEKTVEKGRDPDVVNAARAVLAMYGVGAKGGKSAIDYMQVLETNDPVTFAAVQDSLRASIGNAQPLQALTMEQLQSLHEEIQSMWRLARRTRQMEVAGKLMDIDDAAQELSDRMSAIGVPLEAPGTNSALTPAETRSRWLQFAGSILRRVEQWSEGMDGRYGGPFRRLVFGPVKAAADAYRADKVVYLKRYAALVDNVAPALSKGLIAAPELGYTFGKGHNGIGHAELLHAILHTGNESNKRKLLLGRKWATENLDGTLDTTKWDAFVKRMQDTGMLRKEHYDFAQGVWDLLEQTKPLAQKAHRDVFGRYFAEVTADSFDTPFGAYRGGYVPAQADPRIVPDADMRALANLENESMSFSFPTTSKGFTKGRVEYNRPLMLDLRTIGQHIDKVLLFAHMESAVRDVNKLLSRKPVSQPLGKIDPTIYSGMLTPWLNRSARQVVETPIVGDGGVSRVLSAMRGRAGAALMFANVSNSIQQITGFSGAFAKFKADDMKSDLMRSTARFIRSPKKMAEAVSAASPYMKGRMDNEVAAMQDAMNAILLDPSLYERAQAWTNRHAYFLQSALDNTMGPIIWSAAYNAAVKKGLAGADAVGYADGVIRQTQGSTMPEDVSRIETGPAYARVFTQFIGYFNMMANTNGTALKQISSEIGLKKGAGKALMVVTMGMLVPLWVAEAIAQAMRGGPDDPDGDGWLDDWLAAVFGMGTIKGMFAMVPFIGQLANAGLNRFNTNPADDRVSLSPAVSLLESGAGVPYDVYKYLIGEGKARTTVRDVASLVSIATGLPATALARPLGYLAGVQQGDISPTGPADAARGLITGNPSPESKTK